MAAASRRRRIGQRRHADDEAEDDGNHDSDLASVSDGSGTEDDDPGNDSDTSNLDDETSPTIPIPKKHAGNGAAGRPASDRTIKPIADAEVMIQHLSITDDAHPTPELHFDDVAAAPEPKLSPGAPIIVSSASAPQPPQQNVGGRRRTEHDEYRRKRDEDPKFVPNRGGFYLHDHRHAGPGTNGFRPFTQPGRGGRGRGGFGGNTYVPYGHVPRQPVADPTVTGQWAHDMHEAIIEPVRPRQPRRFQDAGLRDAKQAPEPDTPINRAMSTENHVANAAVRVYLPLLMEKPVIVRGLQIKHYTKLPDHRPPLRNDKPVRISLPDTFPRLIYPAKARSFIFIPRAERPNKKGGMRGGTGPRSIGGYSRRTSVFGGSYYGSTYSPSIAQSRRSSFAHDGRDYVFSPAGSVGSRPPMPQDAARPVVRLPPTRHDQTLPMVHPQAHMVERPAAVSSISNLPPPQTHPLPQKPTFPENRSHLVPMYQPRPQKTVSVADIELPEIAQPPQQQQPPYQQAFHQQVPVQMTNGVPSDTHTRNPSFQSQHSTGTPLSQIPERAIHAAPFQPNAFPQPTFYNPSYPPVMQPQPGYYYSQPYPGGGVPLQSAAAPTFVPSVQQPQPPSYPPQSPPESQGAQGNAQAPNLIAQEVNGTFYYYDPSQLPPVNAYPGYGAPQGYVPGGVGMGGMMNPGPEGFFPYQGPPGMMYYQQ